MANRRMISNTVVRTARFLRMPPTTQNLYFHLVLNTDDDGVVEAFPVMRLIGATEDDLKILVEKVFVYLLNEDLVVYISDWNEQNTIRSDRKVDSVYKNLLLKIVPDIEYKESTKKNGQSVVRQMSGKSQQDDRLSKDKLSKDKLREGSSNDDDDALNVGIQNVDIGNEDIRNVDIQSVDIGNEDTNINSLNDDDALKEIFKLYEKTFGVLNSINVQSIQYWCEDLSVKLMLEALKRSRGAQSFKYTEGILKKWEAKGVKNMSDVAALDSEFEKIKSSKSKKRSIPDSELPETGLDW